jgi:F-type H+-transporting ATPase subunit b
MLQLNLNLFLYQLAVFVVFAVVVTVIYKMLLVPVLRERRERIEGDMARAAAARAEADALKSTYEKKMAQVGDEASAVLKRVNEEAARHREELLAQARHQADALLRKAEELIAVEEKQAVQKIRSEMADLAVAVAGRVLEETRTTKRERVLAEKFLGELESRHPLDGRAEP